MRSARLFALAFAISLSATAPFLPMAAHAQGIITGGISGVVADPTGAVIPGASITATNASTNSTAKAVSGKGGEFSFANLPVGTYTLFILANGFSGATVQGVLVTSGRDQAIGIQKLNTTGAPEVIQVSAAANILETSQAQVTTTFDAQQLTNLPVGSAGGFDELALLIPGVVNTHMDNFSNTNGAGISSNGQRGRANNFELDGQSNNDNSVTGPQVFFSNDEALQEVQIITNNFSAQYGRNMGSVVNYITKSGTNTWHGSAVYKYSGDFTSSRQTGVSKGPQFGFCAAGQTPAADGCLATVVPRYVSNWWGGTLGGAIIKNKLFAFGSTYFQHFTEFGALTTSGVNLYPTTAGLTQLANAFPNNNGVTILQQVSPYAATVGNPRQTGPVVNETVSANGTTISVPFAQYGRQIPTLDSDQEDLGRIDWNATPKDHLYVRYFYQKEPDTPGDSVAAGGFYDVTDAVHSVGADETHIFGPHWVDQLRYSFQQSTLAFNAGGFPHCTITDFSNCPSSVTINNVSSGGASIGALGVPSNFPQGRIVKAGQVQNNATWNIGEHAITFGGEFDYTNSPNTFLPNSSGAFSYDTLNDFIGGSCPSGSLACSVTIAVGNPVIPFKENDFALYIQDDWKISSTFTANLGFRYEFFQQAINLLHNESVANQTGPNPPWDTTLPLSQTTLPAVPDYYKNFEPRIGFAFNPAFQRRLVIRGGYAINVDPAFYNINLNVATSAPLVNLGTVNCDGTVNCLPTGGATFSTVQTQLAPLVPTGGNPGLDDQTNVGSNFRNPMSQTYTLGVQYQINNHNVMEVRYTGNHTARQFQSVNSNPYLAQVAAAFPNVVNPASLCSASASQLDGSDVGFLHCGKTSVNTVQNSAWALYNSLQMSLTTRNYHGVSGTVAFTHSQTTDNASEIYSTGGGGNTIAFAQNPLNVDYGERGASAIDFPNVASISFVYMFPTIHSGHLTDRLVNGWQANAIWFYNSGQPYTDYEFTTSASGQANPNDPRSSTSYSDPFFNAAFIGADVARPIVSNPKAPVGTLGIYTDTGAGTALSPFSTPFLVDYASGAPVTPSDVHFIANNQLAANLLNNPYPGGGRNILRGNTTNNLDFSVFKTTRITERVSFQLRVNAFNILNRSQYNNPGAALNDYNFAYFNNFLFSGAASGSNVGTGTGVRNMTFEGRILF
jgi:hypothetical protein